MNTEQANQACQLLPPTLDVSLPVLMYHSVSDTPTASTQALSVRPGMFGAQLCSLRHQGFTGLTFGELAQRRRTGRRFRRARSCSHSTMATQISLKKRCRN